MVTTVVMVIMVIIICIRGCWRLIRRLKIDEILHDFMIIVIEVLKTISIFMFMFILYATNTCVDRIQILTNWRMFWRL